MMYYCSGKVHIMVRTLICCIFAATFFSSCGYYEHRERQQLYAQIKLTNDTLDRLTREWHSLLDIALRTKNFSVLNTGRIELGQFLSRRRSAIADMELPADAEPLRGSEGVFLSTQADMVADVYPKFELFNDLTPDSTIHNQLAEVSKDMGTELSWNLTIKKSLSTFASRNNLKIRR